MSRVLDKELALELAWTWQIRPETKALLLAPPEGFFYDPADADPLQLVPHWSTDWHAAGQLLDDFGDWCRAALYREHNGWRCSIIPNGNVGAVAIKEVHEFATSAPTAITRARLRLLVQMGQEARDPVVGSSWDVATVRRVG